MSTTSRVSIVLGNDRREMSRLADVVQRFGEANGLSDDETMDIRLVLDELVINVIRYGYDADDLEPHDIRVRLEIDEARRVTFEIDDDARPYDPRTTAEPRFDLPIEQRPIGGLGVHIVKSMVDTFDYRRDGGRNVVTLTKQLTRAV